jgi:hypothetical protein
MAGAGQNATTAPGRCDVLTLGPGKYPGSFPRLKPGRNWLFPGLVVPTAD